MSHTITLTGNYGYTQYKIYSGLDAGSTLDASGASWIVSNSQDTLPVNPYPFLMDHAGLGTTLIGGTIHGEVSQTLDWSVLYYWPNGSHNNSVAVRVENSPGAIIQDWTISNSWDAIRVSRDSNNFLIEDVWVTNTRDDAIENDDALSGTIRDSLLENVFVGVSLGDGGVHGNDDNVVTLDGVLIRAAGSYLYKGVVTGTSPIKMYMQAGDVSPDLRFINTVIAVEDGDLTAGGYDRLQEAWDKTIEASGNFFLNLSDTPLQINYPRPGSGWTILEGQVARDYWGAARAEWVVRHPEASAELDEVPITATFQQGVGGYSGTYDTMLRAAAATSNYAETTSLSVDSADPSPSAQPCAAALC